MTQEYTPTDSEILQDYMPDEEKIGFDARTMSFGRWKKLRKETFERWLAAHDARIRAEASCDIKDSEITVFAQEMFKELEKYGFFACGFTDREEAYENAFEDSENGLYGYDAVEAGSKAVTQLRETPKEEQRR